MSPTIRTEVLLTVDSRRSDCLHGRTVFFRGVLTLCLPAVGSGEDACGHVHRPRTQPADRPAAHQEEPGERPAHFLLKVRPAASAESVCRAGAAVYTHLTNAVWFRSCRRVFQHQLLDIRQTSWLLRLVSGFRYLRSPE